MTSGAPAFLLEENHDLPLCRFQVTLRGGAAQDLMGPSGLPAGAEPSGLCNFATELMRRGAGGRTRAEIDAAIDSLGASLGVSCGRESVCFEVMALKEKLDAAVAILADIVLRPDWPAEEADKLRRELRANLDDLRDDDGSLAWRFFYRELYAGHPYGSPVAGTEESLPHLTLDRSRAWHGRYIRGGNVVFGAAGDLGEGELRALCERHFAALPAGPAPVLDTPEPAPGQGLRLHLIDKPERTQSQILFGQLAPRWDEADWLPLRVASTAFGGTFTARLMDEVRVKRGLSYGASARTGAGRGRPMLWMHVFPSAAQTPETLELVLRLYREWADGGLRDDEVEFAKGYLARGFAFRIETPESRLGLRTELELCGMPADYIARFPSRVLEVSPQAVAEATRRWLRPADLLVTLVGTGEPLAGPLADVPRLREAARQTFAYDSY